MPTYIVHAAPQRAGETTSDPQRFVFVRDGFHFWAFLVGPLWLIYRRLWLALAGYVLVSALLGITFYVIHAPDWARALGALLLALLVGFEAASLRRWTLTRRRWQTLGFVIGDDEESAERRFFAEWERHAAVTLPLPLPSPPPPPREPPYSAPVRRGPPSGSDVIGLFPEPGQ